MAARRLGPYATLEELSSRAFTTTYRAEQPTLGRTVLIRALKPTVSPSSPFAQEVEREAAMLAKLDHPAFIRLFDFVRADETAYLVLEDKRGVMLAELVARGRLGFDAAAAVTLEIARGLGHAHARGVVVKDLRPAVVELGQDGGVRIVELASAYLPSMPSLPEPLEVGDALARPDFMAPEQILGERMGPRSDVFAAGAMFHWLTTGAAPFAADDAKEVAHRVRNDAPAPIPDLPRPYERVLALCLAKDPADRFADGSALAAALEDALAERAAPSTAVLVTRALAAAKLGVELADAPARGRASSTTRVVGRGGPSLRDALADAAVRLRPRHRRRRRARGVARSRGRDDVPRSARRPPGEATPPSAATSASSPRRGPTSGSTARRSIRRRSADRSRCAPAVTGSPSSTLRRPTSSAR